MFLRRKKSEPAPDPKDKHQKIDKMHALKRCALFKPLNGWEISSISKLTRIAEFKKDEVVFQAGDSASFFYIIVSGRFEAYVHHDGQRQILAYLKQGAYFGEMSLLSADERHTATVQSLSDSIVLTISKDDFKKIIENNAAISLEISRTLSARLRASNDRSRPPLNLLRSDIIVVYSSHRKMGQTSFCVNLAASLHRETGQKTVLIDMSPSGTDVSKRLKMPKTDIGVFKDLEKGIEGVVSAHLSPHDSGIEVLNLATGPGTGNADLATHLLNRLAVDFRFIVIDLPNQIDETIVTIMSQADHLFFVTDNSMTNVSEVQQIISELGEGVTAARDKTKIVIIESLLGFSPTRAAREELFGKKECFFLPTSTLARAVTSEDGVVVLAHPDLDYSKVIRFIARKVSKNMVGVALGSGAALGFAHIGVLKALEREGIPVDCIAGSSMGALIAAFYASGLSSLELENIAAKITGLKLSMKIDFSILPIRGLIKGKRLMRYFEEYLGDMTFEQTKIPLIIVGMSLLSRKEIVMTSGLISQAVRASIAIPGIFHPVTIDKDILVDGGIIDPLPIRPLLEMGANKIIAVDVLPTSNDVLEKRRYKDELEKRKDAVMQNKNIAARALYGLRKNVHKFFVPNMVDIIVNSMQTMEHEMAETLSAEADILIRPSMPLINWTDFNRSKDIIKQGEAAAAAKMDELKALVKQQTV